MTMGIVGRKAGMTRIFTEDGASVPVTVIEATPNRVSSVRTLDRDGYEAIQVAVGERKASRVDPGPVLRFLSGEIGHEEAVQPRRVMPDLGASVRYPTDFVGYLFRRKRR